MHCLGEFIPWPKTTWNRAIALYDPHRHRSLAFLYGQDPRVVCLSYAALVLWCLGYPDQALKKSHKALTLAQELSHPFSLAFALDFAAMLHQFRREVQAAQEQAEAVIALCDEQGFPFWLAWGTILQGWALAEQGRGEEGHCTDSPRPSCLSGHRSRGTSTHGFLPYWPRRMAERGQAEEGLNDASRGAG